MTAGPTEADLLQRAATGDRAAFEAFVRSTATSVWTLIRRSTACDSMAEEAFQETFVAAWRGLDRYRGEASPRAWLYGVARNQAARTWRRRAGEPTFTESIDEHLGLAAGWGSDPEVAASRAEDRRHLEAALKKLSDNDQEILGLCDLRGLAATEAADILGLQPTAARVRLHRARLRLMAVLRKGGTHA